MYALKIDRSSPELRRIENLIEDIEQSIEVILTTPKGAKIFEPEFGSELMSYIDRIAPNVTPRLIAEVWDAIERWEDMVKLLNVDVEEVKEEGFYRFVVKLEYEIKELGRSHIQALNLTLR
jgi:phage baseplate assembly protein W